MIPLEALCNLASPDSPASWSPRVAKWAQGAEIAEIVVTVDDPQARVTKTVLRLDVFFQEGTVALP